MIKPYNTNIGDMAEEQKDRVLQKFSDAGKQSGVLVGDVIGQLPTNEEINLIIEHDLPESKEYAKYSDKEKQLMMAATKAGAKWFRGSLIEGNFR